MNENIKHGLLLECKRKGDLISELAAVLAAVQCDYIAWAQGDIENPITMETESKLAEAVKKAAIYLPEGAK